MKMSVALYSLFNRLKNDLIQLILTFGLALLTGWLALHAGLPAPYLMGALFGVWFGGALMGPGRARLGVPRWLHIPVVIGLGVLIGANFNSHLTEQAYRWLPTVLAMIATTVIVTGCGFVYLHKFRGYDRPMAFLCAIPGGQAEAIIIARELVDKDYVVALFHLVRVAIVFISTPLLMRLIQGNDAVIQSNITLHTMPGITDLALDELLSFIAVGLVGAGGARLLRLPIAHLLGPMLLSLVCHAGGWLALPRLGEFVILAQLTIGGAVGARLSQVPFAELSSYLRDAVTTAVLIISVYLVAALVIAVLSQSTFLSVWLAFVPGGLYEVTLLALIFGFDVAFSAFHHTVRILLIFFSLPVIAYRFRGKKPFGQGI